MKTKTGMTLLSGLLLSSPALMDVVHAEVAVVRPATKSSLFVSSQGFTATTAQGFTRKVLIGLRVTKNGNNQGEDYFKCKASAVPDSITVEILDPQTKKVLHVSQRMFAKLGSGVNVLLQNSSTYSCVVSGTNLSIEGDVARIDSGTAPVTLEMGDTASVKIPGKLSFRKSP